MRRLPPLFAALLAAAATLVASTDNAAAQQVSRQADRQCLVCLGETPQCSALLACKRTCIRGGEFRACKRYCRSARLACKAVCTGPGAARCLRGMPPVLRSPSGRLPHQLQIHRRRIGMQVDLWSVLGAIDRLNDIADRWRPAGRRALMVAARGTVAPNLRHPDSRTDGSSGQARG